MDLATLIISFIFTVLAVIVGLFLYLKFWGVRVEIETPAAKEGA